MNTNATIRVTKEFRFESAHALKGYDGPCRNVHGHSYSLSVTISGTPVICNDSPKLGMVMDFGDLKKLIRENITDPLDHALLLSTDNPEADLKNIGEPFTNIKILPFQPTSENLLIDFADRIRKVLPPDIKLHSLRLRETSNSYAEWYASDNL
jgi:6-pyruvoyltetrahydropterin/6-carboxytetrahydropterin synthase